MPSRIFGVRRRVDEGQPVDCLRDIYAATDIGTFGEQIISRLRNVIPCSGVLFGNYDLCRMRSEFVADHPDAKKVPLDQIIATLPRNHQHPYWPHYLKTQDPRATKLSDFMSRREFHSKGFYTELYKPLGAEAEMGCMLVIAPDSHLTYVAAIRDGGDFTERDRVVLNLLQPHLAQAYRNANALTGLREAVRLARSVLESLDHGVIVRSRNGAVRLVTERARAWLNEYFPSNWRSGALPERLERWLGHRSSSFDTRNQIPEPMRPLVVERAGKRLVVRPALDEDRTILVLAEEWTSVDPRSLESLGLTRREAEVSAWVAEGKTNAEIAQILGVRPLTVKKHLEHILAKLGVENRTAAAGLILDQRMRMKLRTGGG